MATKVTIKDMFNEVIALATEVGRQDVVEFAEHEIELLDKRNSADSKAKAKKAAENAALADKIVEYLATVEDAQATLDVATAVGISTQKATPILKGLVNEGRLVDESRLVVTAEKRKKFYAIAQ